MGLPGAAAATSSSSCPATELITGTVPNSAAAAAVAHRLGLVDNDITVRMPGGTIRIEIAPDFSIRMEGPVTRVGTLELDPEAIEDVRDVGR